MCASPVIIRYFVLAPKIYWRISVLLGEALRGLCCKMASRGHSPLLSVTLLVLSLGVLARVGRVDVLGVHDGCRSVLRITEHIRMVTSATPPSSSQGALARRSSSRFPLSCEFYLYILGLQCPSFAPRGSGPDRR